MKKFTILFLLIFLISNSIIISAKDLPNEFWAYNDKYAQAVEQKDNLKIIEYGEKSIELIKYEPQTDQINEIMGSRLDQIGLAYERLGKYTKAGICYGQYIPYAELKGWNDGVKIAKAKVLQYTPNADLYLALERKSEKVLFGANFDGAIRENLPDETMILVYLEFGDSDFTWVEKTLKEAQEKGISVELAWNLPQEGEQLASVLGSEKYVVSVLNMIGKYNVNVFLRFGAEMNIWQRKAKSDEFINAFKFVSILSKRYTANTKMVWSVNQVSSWDTDMNDYYPGDEYVDFVGVSAYAQKYFLGKNDWSEFDRFNEIVFLTGKSADPVKALTEVVSRYGDRKPIIIAEGGASHFVNSLNEDTTDWAVLNLKKMYCYLPMVYPQVKMMAYFDRFMPNEVNDFSLTNSQKMADTYKALTKLPHFVGTVSYEKLENTLEIEQQPQEIYSYIHIYGQSAVNVDYYVDGEWVTSASEIPYNKVVDFSKYQLGEHNIRVAVSDNGSFLYEKNYNINIVERSISVTINDKKVLFDTAPIMINDRTLVPMRAIFEELGANVNWDAATQTISSNFNGMTIKMQIGSEIMTQNNKVITLDVAPIIFGDRTLVPVRAISEVAGAQVTWDDETKTVKIIKKQP